MAVRKKNEVVVKNNEVMTEESTQGIIPEVVDCESEQKNPVEQEETVPATPEPADLANFSPNADEVEETVPSTETAVLSADSAPEADSDTSDVKKVSFSFAPTKFESTSRVVVSGEAVLSIVCTEKNGKRIAISPNLVLDKLKVTDKVQVAYSSDEKAIILAKNLGGSNYKLCDLANKKVIYNKELVEYLRDAIKLDFSDKSTVSFYSVEVVKHEQYGLMAVVSTERGVV